jgi:hypothetical protein
METDMATPKALRFRMTLGMTDFIIGVMLIAGIIILYSGTIRPQSEIAPSASTALDMAVLLGFPAVLSVVIGVGSSADRRCVDDFANQLLATSALVGMFAMIGVNSLWAIDSLRDAIGVRGLRGSDMLAIGQVSWAVAYVAFRIRGGVL